MESDIIVRPLQESDLPTADYIMRVAFGTFIGLPQPETFLGDANYVRSRWYADPTAVFAAESNGQLIGSNFANNWGSVGFFGPLTVRPDYWDRGVGKLLMGPIMALFDKWGTRHAGLFTFPHSQKHIGLYQRFGFWPRFLTALMSKTVEHKERASDWTKFSEVPTDERPGVLDACRQLTGAIYDGLDVGREINAVASQKLGDTILVWDKSRLVAFAVCHHGPGTEAGTAVCYIKFAAVLPSNAQRDFGRLLNACEEMSAEQGLTRIVTGVNTARHEAYLQMMAHGFRNERYGLVMSRPNEEGYNRRDVYILDDWR